MADFLLEIGLEEVPARMIAAAQQDLSTRLRSLLERERLVNFTGSNIWEGGERLENGVPVPAGLKVQGQYLIRSYSTPRRLAVHVKGVKLKQDDFKEQLIGPSWKVAFKEGAPTPAAEAFAKKAGVAVDALLKITNAKGEYVCAYVERTGRTTAEVLAAELPKEVLSLYWAKNMYWRAAKPERFVRPVRWVVALLDASIVPLEIAGIAAGNTSRGHRILHGEAPVVIEHASQYSESLRAAFVVVDVAQRRAIIRKALDAVTRTVPGARWREDEPLIETVVHLTEWPSVILGNFEPEYLALPEEVLVTVMRDHQKYFAVEDAAGKLAPHFLAVLNTQADEAGAAIIRHGNARVLRARFKDARFFWDFDQKTPLIDRMDSLKNVTFQKELGSYFWKTEENKKIVWRLIGRLNVTKQVLRQELPDKDAALAAVQLAKTDLTTELVKEFTELQGVIGGLYAKKQGYDSKVADAIYWQYRPINMEDEIPPSAEGQILGVADRAQTIVSMFSKGFIPSGSKDPFALRRAANAMVKIIAESNLPFTVKRIFDVALEESGISSAKLQADVYGFMRERLHFYLKDVRGFAYDIVNAVLAAGTNDVVDAISRAGALTAVRGSEDFIAVCEAAKRIKNILRQAAEKGTIISDEVPQASALTEPEERQLLDSALELQVKFSGLQGEREYVEALAAIATLRPIVYAFFDKPVVVFHPDPAVCATRLALLRWVQSGFLRIADFSEIVTT
jgi:glycyl-tRNA synthetase beta chain